MHGTASGGLRHRVYRGRRALARGLVYTTVCAFLLAVVGACVGLLLSGLGGFLAGAGGQRTTWAQSVLFAAWGCVTGLVVGLLLTVVSAVNAFLRGDAKDKREQTAVAEVARFNRWAGIDA